ISGHIEGIELSLIRQFWQRATQAVALIWAREMRKRFSALINTRFQPGAESQLGISRFNGFPAPPKPLKRFPSCSWARTGLKPGVNESGLGKTALLVVLLLAFHLSPANSFPAEKEDAD